MLTSELKPKEEILSYLAEGERVFLVACAGCAEVCEAGGEEALRALSPPLEEAGHPVAGAVSLPFLCNKALVGMRLSRFASLLEGADSVLVASCGVGIQAVAQVVKKPVHPASNTTSQGAFQGVWPSEERCARCGDCVLEWTGGICPLTACTKGLLNGPCGGAKEGRCEFEPQVRPCGWELIYERLKRQGRLDLLKKSRPQFKDYSKMEPPKDLRSTWL